MLARDGKLELGAPAAHIDAQGHQGQALGGQLGAQLDDLELLAERFHDVGERAVEYAEELDFFAALELAVLTEALVAEHTPQELSGGMKQRLEVARALAVNPDVLYLDEPFGALDEQTRFILQEELLRIWEKSGKTVLFVTHSIEEALLIGNRILVLSPHPGRVKAELNAGHIEIASIQIATGPQRDRCDCRSFTRGGGSQRQRVQQPADDDTGRLLDSIASSREFAHLRPPRR